MVLFILVAQFFETRIENLEKSIPPSVCSRNNRKSKKGSKTRKLVSLDDSDDEDSDEGHIGKKFCNYRSDCGHTTNQCTTLKELIKQAKEKRANILIRTKGSPNMRKILWYINRSRKF